MYADQIAAAWTGPFPFLTANEKSNTPISNHLQVIQHAHVILAAVALIELLKSFAWIFFTRETIFSLSLGKEVTVFDDTADAVIALIGVVTATAGTMVFLTLMGHTEAAIHPARGDVIYGDRG